MRKTRDIIIGAAIVTAMVTSIFGAALATDYSALRKDARVHQELTVAAIVYLVEKNCPNLERHMLRGAFRALSLQSYARGLGYTNRELSAFVDNLEEQDRFRAIAWPILADLGAVKGDSESFCAVGRAEMKRGSNVGAMLRAR